MIRSRFIAFGLISFCVSNLAYSEVSSGSPGTHFSSSTKQSHSDSAITPHAGVQFSCSPEQIRSLERDFSKLFTEYGWLGDVPKARITTSSDKTKLQLGLLTPSGDTDTLTLHSRPEFKIKADVDSFTDRAGISHDYEIASEKEIIASMLQRGRLFEFDQSFCKFDKFLEHVQIRKNIIRWGIRAMWKFPEGDTQYNKTLWAPSWTLQPGIKSSAAIADAFTGKIDYEIGCTKACQLIMAQGILDYYENVKKDKKMIDHLDGITAPTPLDTMEMIVNGDSKHELEREGTLVDRHFKVPADHWVPGDWGWIKNPDSESAAENGLEGCNIVYIGRGLFVVYYKTDPDRTLDQALVRVYQWRRSSIQEEDTPELRTSLRKDPRDGGLLRDVRDFPKNFQIKKLNK